MIERPKPQYRSGIGTDIHELVKDRPLMLCGIKIPFDLGLMGHSDGDVALHAVIDSLLGAAGLGDIGELFPDTDERWRNVDSKKLVMAVKELITERDWEIANVDLIIHAERPKLSAFKGQMRRSLADLLEINFDAANIKAKTNEGFGEIGSGQAIAATAITLLMKKYRRTLDSD